MEFVKYGKIIWKHVLFIIFKVLEKQVDLFFEFVNL